MNSCVILEHLVIFRRSLGEFVQVGRLFLVGLFPKTVVL